jgi:hypothetical protein
MLTRLFAYVIFSAAFGAMFGIALRALATALGWSGGTGKRVRRLEAVAICLTAGFWLFGAPVIVPIGTDLLTARGMDEADAFTLMVTIVVPCNALLGVVFGWIIGPDPGPKPPTALANPYANESSIPPSEQQASLTAASDIPLAQPVNVTLPSGEPFVPSLELGEDPPKNLAEEDTSRSTFTGMADRLAMARGRPEELWSSYGRDAFFLAVVSLLLTASACIVPVLGVFLAGIVGMIAAVMAVRAIVVTGDRSSKGLAFAIVALIVSLVPIGFATVSLLGTILSALTR